MPIPQLSKGHAFFSKIEGKIYLYNSMKDDEKIIISIKSAQELIKNGHSKRAILQWQRQEKVIKLAPRQYIKSRIIPLPYKPLAGFPV